MKLIRYSVRILSGLNEHFEHFSREIDTNKERIDIGQYIFNN